MCTLFIVRVSRAALMDLSPDHFYLPPRLVSGMRFRSMEQDGERLGARFRGSDVRLFLAILSAWAFIHPAPQGVTTISVQQSFLANHLGRIHKDRLEASIQRLLATDIWTGERWLPVLVDCLARPGTPTRPGVPVGDEWIFDIGPNLAEVVSGDLFTQSRPFAFSFNSAPLQQLESRHAVILYCRYKAWMAGYPPTGALGTAMFPSGIGIRLDVAAEDLGPVVFGFDGRLPPSIIYRLFVTEGHRPPVHLELRRADIDMLVTPVASGVRKELSYDVRIGDMIRKTASEKSMAALNDALTMTEASVIRKRVPHRKKRGIKANAS